MSWAGYDESEMYKQCSDMGALPSAPTDSAQVQIIADFNKLVIKATGEMWINIANFNSAFGDWQDIGVEDVYGYKYGGHSYWIVPNAADMTFDASRNMDKWAEADRNRATFYHTGIKPLMPNYYWNKMYEVDHQTLEWQKKIHDQWQQNTGNRKWSSCPTCQAKMGINMHREYCDDTFSINYQIDGPLRANCKHPEDVDRVHMVNYNIYYNSFWSDHAFIVKNMTWVTRGYLSGGQAKYDYFKVSTPYEDLSANNQRQRDRVAFFTTHPDRTDDYDWISTEMSQMSCKWGNVQHNTHRNASNPCEVEVIKDGPNKGMYPFMSHFTDEWMMNTYGFKFTQEEGYHLPGIAPYNTLQEDADEEGEEGILHHSTSSVEWQYWCVAADLEDPDLTYNLRLCNEPEHLLGKVSNTLCEITCDPLADTAVETCPDGFEGPTCKKNVNECGSYPCMNGGTCSDLQAMFECTCPTTYNGVRCEIERKSPCQRDSGNPCQNGGLCQAPDYDTYVCKCPTTHVGEHCEYEKTTCDHVCQPGTTTCSSLCVNGDCSVMPSINGGYACNCRAGYHGLHCDRAINECESDPCKNGAPCIDGLLEYRCECPTGTYGDPNCDYQVDECSSTPCSENGKCENDVNGEVWLDYYHCVCDDGFYGLHCENNINECASYPCAHKNKGYYTQWDCVDGKNSYKCECNQDWRGENCDINIEECAAGSWKCDCKTGGSRQLCKTVSNNFTLIVLIWVVICMWASYKSAEAHELAVAAAANERTNRANRLSQMSMMR